jgi:hypothetical protein
VFDSDEDAAPEVLLAAVDFADEEVVALLAEVVNELTAPDTFKAAGAVLTPSAPARSEARRTRRPPTTTKSPQKSRMSRPRTWTKRRGESTPSSSLLPSLIEVIAVPKCCGERENALRSRRSACFSDTPAGCAEPRILQQMAKRSRHGRVAWYCLRGNPCRLMWKGRGGARTPS